MRRHRVVVSILEMSLVYLECGRAKEIPYHFVVLAALNDLLSAFQRLLS